MTGPPAPVPAGPRGTATSAMATGFPISIGFAVPIVATSFCILSQGVSVSSKPVLAGDRSRSLSVSCRWFCCFSEVGRGLKLSAKGERGDIRVPGHPAPEHHGSLSEPTECPSPVTFPGPHPGRPVSGVHSVTGPSRCHRDRPIR